MGHAALLLACTTPAVAMPWGPQHIGGPCPIVYPFSNETRFCASVGRQRWLARVDEEDAERLGGVACADIPWRRRDNASAVGVLVLGASANVSAIRSLGDFPASSVTNTSRSVGTVCWRTDGASEQYAIYFLPFGWSFDGGSGSYHSHFLAPASAGPSLPSSSLPPGGGAAATATLLGGMEESFSSFDARSPMELIATDAEVAAVVERASENGADYVSWCAQVTNTSAQTPRMPQLPAALASSAPNTTALVTTPAGGVAVVQVVLFAVTGAIRGVQLEFDAVGDIPASAFTSLTTVAIDYRGAAYAPPLLSIARGEARALLVGVQVPAGTAAGAHAGHFVVRPTMLGKSGRSAPLTVDVTIHVQAALPVAARAAHDASDGVWGLERMLWLESRAGLDASLITRPFTPLQQSPDGGISTLHFRGRTLQIEPRTGLPSALESSGRAVLSEPAVFDVLAPGGRAVQWGAPAAPPAAPLLADGNASAAWSVTRRSLDGALSLCIEGRVEYDGNIQMAATLSTRDGVYPAAAPLEAVSLRFAVSAEVARFADGGGFGDHGGFFPASNASALSWRWSDVPGADPHTPAGDPVAAAGWRLWVGDVDAGLFFKLKGLDVKWNEARGGAPPTSSWAQVPNASGFDVSSTGSAVTMAAVSALGPQALQSGPLVYNWTVMATPVKGDYQHTAEGKEEHYNGARHFHVPYGEWSPPLPQDLARDLGITTYILHQSNKLNPFINYPYHPSVVPALQAVAADARAAGVRTKLYYTVGQLSNHAPELFALAGLGRGEVLTANAADVPVAPRLGGMGGTLMGNEWLEEHMVSGYAGGWFTQNPGGEEDASVGDNTTSRFMNFYIAGQGWLYNNVGIGGLYYDGFGAERFVQQRIRRMTQQSGGGAAGAAAQPPMFDVHGRAFQNTELLPFVDSMWTCEGIDFTQSPAYWLISISALPFGTFGEMLGSDSKPPVPGTFCGESCANKWRGMLFGMSNRAGWNGYDPNDNKNLWKLWDAFGIVDANMYGWWNQSAPLSTGNADVLATAYVRRGNATLIAIASWSTEDVNVTLSIDLAALGLRPGATLAAPCLPSFNRANTSVHFDLGKPLTVPALQGWLLILQ